MQTLLINSQIEKELILKEIECLCLSDKYLTLEEKSRLDFLENLIEESVNEIKTEITGLDILKELMCNLEITEKDLPNIFVRNESFEYVMGGKRNFTEKEAKLLAERFNVDYKLFLI